MYMRGENPFNVRPGKRHVSSSIKKASLLLMRMRTKPISNGLFYGT